MAYSSRSDIENVYGRENIARWADIDNDQDSAKVNNRIAWAITMADARIDGRLRGGYYTVPFTTDTYPIPTLIVLLSSTLAGIMLYDSRLLVDSGTPDEISMQRRNYEMWVKELTSGQTLLENYGTSNRTPYAVTAADEQSAGSYSDWWVDRCR